MAKMSQIGIDAEVLTKQPTVIATSVASKGGIFNGNFDTIPPFVAVQTGAGWINGSASGSTTDDKYGWYGNIVNTTCSCRFDPNITHSGSASLKLSTTDATGRINSTLFGAGAPTIALMTKYLPQIKPSTTYKFSYWIKTYNAAADAAYVILNQYDSSAVLGSNIATTKLSGTNDWTYISNIFTSDSDAAYISIILANYVAGNVSDVWFDDIKLEEIIDDTSNTLQVPTVLKATIDGLVSIDNIDQAQMAGNSGYPIGYSGGAQYLFAQSFVPTKNKITTVSLVKLTKTGTPTGNVNISIRTDNAGAPSTTHVASYEFTNAAFNALPDSVAFDTPLPCILTEGTTYWIVVRDTVTEGATNSWNFYVNTVGTYTSGGMYYSTNGGTNWNVLTGYDVWFKVCYAKPTTDVSIVCNGEKIALSTNEDGLLYNSLVDLDKGEYFYSGTTGLATIDYYRMADYYYATAGGGAAASQTAVNDWFVSVVGGVQEVYSNGATAVERYVTMKVNTMLPIKHLKMQIKMYAGAAGDKLFQVSADNVNWTTLWTASGNLGGRVSNTVETDLMNGLTTFYIRSYKGAFADYCLLGIHYIKADLDTSSVSLPIIYPLSTNQFADEVILPLVATRVYYRTSKYVNKNNIIIPHFEFTDGTGAFIKSVPCKIDNIGESSPAVNIIIADTTYSQQVGTGSADSTTGYILNDGEYMTFSTVVDTIKLTYKVGTGTTSFSNITKNRIYLSSNGNSNSGTKDPSLQMWVSLWYRVQSIIKTVNDLVKKVSDVSNETFHTFKEVRGSGTAYSMTNAFAPVTFGTSGVLTLTLPEPGIYLITGNVEDYPGSSYNTTGTFSYYDLYIDGSALGDPIIGLYITASAAPVITMATIAPSWTIQTTKANTVVTLYARTYAAMTSGIWYVKSEGTRLRYLRIG